MNYTSSIVKPAMSIKNNVFKVNKEYENLTDLSSLELVGIIEEQNKKLEAIIDSISEEMLIFDKNGDFINVNKNARYFANIKTMKNFDDGYEHFELFYMNGNPIPYEDMPIQRVIKGERITNYRIALKNDGGTLYKELNGIPIYDGKGNFIEGVISIHDITESLNNEEAQLIKTQYGLLNGIIENFGLGFLRFSYPAFEIIDCNNKVFNDVISNYSKLSSTNIIGRCITEFFPDDHNIIFADYMQTVAEKKCICSINMKVSNAGENKTLKMAFQPVLGLDGQVVEIVVLIVDITEEVKDKEKMEKVLKIQDEIYANVSHELKTPINVICSANQLIEMYLKNDTFENNKQKLSNYSSIIKQNCFRLTKLINNIVDLSRSNSGFLKLNLSNENIVDIVENIVISVSEYVKSNKQTIIFDTNVEEKIIACDSNMIERVMLNLISNAIKFSNPKGEIYVNIFDKGDVVEISVQDTGTGIEKKHLDLIFQRFYQADKSLSRNAEGTGIGLSLIKTIVDLHGGKISVESEVGKGSIFKVELPSSTIENQEVKEKTNDINNKIEMINIEFSDIYSIY